MSEEVVAVAEVAPVAAPVESQTLETVETEVPAEPRVYTQEEVDKIAAKVKKNERYRTKKEVEAYYQGRESVAPKPAEAVVEAKAADAPLREQFDSYEAFLEAKAEYTGRKAGNEAMAKMEKAASEKAAKESAEKTAQAFRDKVLQKFPKINEQLEDIGDMPIYRGVQQAISESELGPEIFNELVSKPSEFDRLMKLGETAAIREIGKLEARLELKEKPAPTTETKKPSNAPAPIRPVVPKAAATDDEPSHDKPDEWARWRNRQVLKKRTGTK